MLELCVLLCDRLPVDPRDHRPFTRAFIRAVHQATGKTFGPDIYRRLLKVYGPGRRPSNDTLAAERRVFDQELAALSAPPVAGAASGPAFAPDFAQPALPIAAALRCVLDEYIPLLARNRGNGQGDPHVDFITARLAESEHSLAEARAHAARLAGQLQEQTALALARQEQLAALQTALAAQAQATTQLASEVDAMRRHSLMSIDAVRGETRLVQERCARQEAVIKQKDAEIDMLRMRGAGATLAGGAR